MIIQSTLVTSHKGVDLHAETAGRVMMRDLEGGDRLVRLRRADFHTFWHESGTEAPESIDRLLGVGRFFNPNKHHYAHFELQNAGTDWFKTPARGSAPTTGWPGSVRDTDLAGDEAGLVDALLGGAPAAGETSVDVLAFPLGESGPLLSGVIWRLVFAAGTTDPKTLAASLVEARGASQGLLVNPHMQGWLATAAREGV